MLVWAYNYNAYSHPSTVPVQYSVSVTSLTSCIQEATFLFHLEWCYRSDPTAQCQDPTADWLFAQTSAMLSAQQHRIQDLDLLDPACS